MSKTKTRTKVKPRPAKTARRVDAGKTPTKPKSSACIGLLSRKEGASIEELQRAAGWQSHSVRGFLSGKVKKTAGLTLTSEKAPDGVRRYHVKSA